MEYSHACSYDKDQDMITKVHILLVPTINWIFINYDLMIYSLL